jgi:hypothetical protein
LDRAFDERDEPALDAFARDGLALDAFARDVLVWAISALLSRIPSLPCRAFTQMGRRYSTSGKLSAEYGAIHLAQHFLLR